MRDPGLLERARHGGVVGRAERTERPAVRIAAERDTVLDRQRARRLFVGRDERQHASQRSRGQRFERAALERDRAGLDRQQAREHAHERRLAGGVRAHQRQGLAGVQRERHVVQHGAAAACGADAAGRERALTSGPRCERSASRKYGRADEGGQRAERQVETIRERARGEIGKHHQHAPPRKDAGSRCRESGPTCGRSACGAIRPTNGTEPATAVAAPATSDASANSSRRVA